ncbi:MAG: hypothetical protein IKE04_05530 [Oscillospiraceae bacterium]|nr:hypothetical protein [Oscillospiraceae bacterium]
MPNRIIKESIRTSRSVNELSDFDFRLWVYLITYVDDFGRGSADPELLKGLVFTRRKGVTDKQISDGIARLANAGMVNLYEVDGEPFLYFPTWAEHQRVRNSIGRYPAPDDSLQPEAAVCGDSRQLAASCGESRRVAASCGESRPESNPESRIQNTESRIQNHTLNGRACAREREIDGLFDQFWEAYPRHDTRAEARKAFEKLKPDEALLKQMLTAIERWRASEQWQNPRYIPQPRTWLNQRRWEDEPVSGGQSAVDKLWEDIERGKYDDHG